jgi:hypothetical protein
VSELKWAISMIKKNVEAYVKMAEGWYGDKEEEISGMHFAYYTEETFGEIVGSEYKLF